MILGRWEACRQHFPVYGNTWENRTKQGSAMLLAGKKGKRLDVEDKQ